MSDRPLASVSLDSDDLWAYLRTHGDPSWSERPSYHPLFFPRVLDVLDELQLRITFFLVGFDAAREEHAPLWRAVTARGHEVGNHSFHHDCWLHRYGAEELDREIARGEEAILASTGQRPLGFRGPGFSWSPQVLEVLARRGYLYDASTLPTFLAPLARRYFLATARLTREELEERQGLFGSFRDGFRPVRAYRWRLESGRTLLEIPVTTMPVVKVPFHLSYLMYLSRVSEMAMVAYLRTAIAMCRLARVEPSFLLHPLDLLGGDEVSQLAFFPGMDLTSRVKERLFARVLRILGEHFRLVPMGEHARALLTRGQLGQRAMPSTADGQAAARRAPA